MRNVVIVLETIGFMFILLGLFVPVLGVIGLYILIMPFAIVLMEIGRLF